MLLNNFHHILSMIDFHYKNQKSILFYEPWTNRKCLWVKPQVLFINITDFEICRPFKRQWTALVAWLSKIRKPVVNWLWQALHNYMLSCSKGYCCQDPLHCGLWLKCDQLHPRYKAMRNIWFECIQTRLGIKEPCQVTCCRSRGTAGKPAACKVLQQSWFYDRAAKYVCDFVWSHYRSDCVLRDSTQDSTPIMSSLRHPASSLQAFIWLAH